MQRWCREVFHSSRKCRHADMQVQMCKVQRFRSAVSGGAEVQSEV